MKEIKLTNMDAVALVDDEDYGILSLVPWRGARVGRTVYAVWSYRQGGKARFLAMHREVIGLTWDDKIEVDHANRNGLDNRKENLRMATSSQNHANQAKWARKASSEFKGVYRRKRNHPWAAQIAYRGTSYHLGSFKTEIEAALAYNFGAKMFFGPFARLNDVEKDSK